MSVIDLHECLRARISQMADEHMQMQEAIMGLPRHEVAAACAQLEQHAIEMSRLARRIEDSQMVRCSNSSKLEVKSESDLASNLELETSNNIPPRARPEDQ